MSLREWCLDPHHCRLPTRLPFDPGATMEIDTTHLDAEVPAEPPTEKPAPSPANGGPQPAAQASAGDSDDDFDILDRLDSLLSDDPSKSSPTRSDK